LVGLGSVLLLTYSLSGHNAATGDAVAVFIDWLHVTAMSVWIGGLLPLMILLLGQRKWKDENVTERITLVSHHFSDLALMAVILLGISGLFSALVQVRTLDALLNTRYGQTLLLKTALFALLIAFGAVNRLFLLPARRARRSARFNGLGEACRQNMGSRSCSCSW
jgi:copper transport protein